MKSIRKAMLLQKRKWRIRKKVTGTAVRPRLSVKFSGKHIYAQAVNDDAARKERADHARQQIRGAFSWRALAARFDALYTDVLDRAS